MSDRTAETAARPRGAEPSSRARPEPAAFGVDLPAAGDPLVYPRRLASPQRPLAILGMQRTVGNHAVQRLIRAEPAAIRRQPRPDSPPQMSGTHTITDPNAAIRGGPTDFKPTGKNFAVGTRVDVVDTQPGGKRVKGTFVNVAEPGTGNPLGWTSIVNLGDVQYAQAASSFVYVAKVAPRAGHTDALPIMVYVPPKFDGTKKTDIVVYFHGDAADYSATTANNYDRENPAIGMHLSAGATGAVDRIVIAPQGNEWTAGGSAIHAKSPWDTLHAGDYETIVQTALTNLQGDLHLTGAIPRGTISIAGHSGGGKALGQAALDLDKTGDGVKDVTLVDAGYGGRENATGGTSGSFAKSFQMVRDWLLDGTPDKVLRVLTKQSSAGTDTRTAIENVSRPPRKVDPTAERIPVLGLEGVENAIKAKGRDAELQADATEVATDPTKRTGEMHLIRKIVVSHKKDNKVQGTIFVFVMTDPPRAKGVDTHFGLRDATIGDIVSGQGKGADFGSH
jgi:hypothetical protein